MGASPALAARSTRSRPLLWVALGASLWGTDTVLRRPLTAALGSTQIVLIEHLILAATLLPACWRACPQWRTLGVDG